MTDVMADSDFSYGEDIVFQPLNGVMALEFTILIEWIALTPVADLIYL